MESRLPGGTVQGVTARGERVNGREILFFGAERKNSQEDLTDTSGFIRIKRMGTLTFRRKSVCMGDDAGNGEYTIEMPDTATLGDLMRVILHGGNGNDWPIPYTGANSFWVIKSNIGNLADIFTDTEGEWHIACLACTEDTPLNDLGITWAFGDRGLDPADKRSVYNGYEAGYMTGKEIKEYLSDAYSRVGPYHEQTAGTKINIQRFKRIQDDMRYRVFYNDGFIEIMDAETDAELYWISYIKRKPELAP